MPQKIDIHGIFIDPEIITDLQLQKRISVFYPVFHEVASSKSVFGRLFTAQKHILQFDHQQPYGIILADQEQPDPSSYIVNYKEAAIDWLFRNIGQIGKNINGHIAELLKIDISGDRQFRILQSGRQVKQTSIREIPAKVKLLSGQWIDVFMSSPEYDFQGGSPYAVTNVGSSALMIETKDKIYILYGAGVDASDNEVITSYKKLTDVYNQIQKKRDEAIEAQKNRPLFQLPNIQLPIIELPKVELPKIDLPQIRFQSPIIFGEKEESKSSESK